MRPIPRLSYHSPNTIDETLELISTLENTKVIAGGTDVVVQLKQAAINPAHLIDLNNVAELNYIKEDDEYIHIGATTTLYQAANNPITQKLPSLIDAITRIGSPQIRNRATIIGNLCNASPAADSALPLLVHDAEVTIKSQSIEKIIPLTKLFTGPKINSLRPNELVTEIRVPRPPLGSSSSFKRIGRRKAFTLSVVSSAAYLELEGDLCKDAKVAFGSVAITPLRVPEVEALMKGKELTSELIAEVGELSMSYVQPITDVRGTAEYRKDMCGVLVKRAINAVLERVG